MNAEKNSSEKKVTTWFKTHLFSGLLVWVPLVVTFVVVSFVVDLMDKTLLLLPDNLQPDVLLGFHLPGLGLVLSVVIVVATGIFIANYIGSTLIGWWENILGRIPLVKSIYTAVKQVIETVATPNGTAFRKVCLVEWPRREMWTIAFQTTNSDSLIENAVEPGMLNVFVPATPNITSGFLMMVHQSQIKELDISIEEALKLVVSLGVVQPSPQALEKTDDK